MSSLGQCGCAEALALARDATQFRHRGGTRISVSQLSGLPPLAATLLHVLEVCPRKPHIMVCIEYGRVEYSCKEGYVSDPFFKSMRRGAANPSVPTRPQSSTKRKRHRHRHGDSNGHDDLRASGFAQVGGFGQGG